MNRIVTATLVAAVTTAVSWGVKQWLERRAAWRTRGPRRQVETWENEGGAIEPQLASIASSQVPRRSARGR